jgi:hypothetical protein
MTVDSPADAPVEMGVCSLCLERDLAAGAAVPETESKKWWEVWK